MILVTQPSGILAAAQDSAAAPQVTSPALGGGDMFENADPQGQLSEAARRDGTTLLTDISQSSWLKNIDMEKGHVSMVAGRSQLLRLERSIARISLSNPDIVDAAILSPNEIVLNAREEGASNIILWDHLNRVTVFDISVTEDPDLLYQVLNRIAPESTFQVYPSNDVFVVEGEVDSVAKQREVEKAASAFAEGSVSLVRVAGARQILLKIRFVQLDHSQNFDFGVDAQYLGRTFGPLLRPGGTSGTLSSTSPFTPANGVQAFNTLSTVPSASGVHWFPYFSRNESISAFVKAIESKGIGKIIARPDLLASDGQEASFLVGGEAAVVAISDSNVGVDYREFGTRLTFTPEILPSGKIRLTVAPEVSQLDFANGVSVNSVTIPSFTTIRTNTVVELGNGETLLIGGLLQQKITISDSGVPFLRRIPLLGKLFDNVNHDYQDIELLVIVTPTIVDPMKAPIGQEPTDGDALVLATQFQDYKVKDAQQEAIATFLKDNQRYIRDQMTAFEKPAVVPVETRAVEVTETSPAVVLPPRPQAIVSTVKTIPMTNLDEMENELQWESSGASSGRTVSRPMGAMPPVSNVSLKTNPGSSSSGKTAKNITSGG